METPVTPSKEIQSNFIKGMPINSWEQKQRFLHRGDTVTARSYYEDCSRPLVLNDWIFTAKNHHFPP
jgi:hypothetical protein